MNWEIFFSFLAFGFSASRFRYCVRERRVMWFVITILVAAIAVMSWYAPTKGP